MRECNRARYIERDRQQGGWGRGGADAHVFPSENRLAAVAIHVGNCVQARNEVAVFLQTQRDIDTAHTYHQSDDILHLAQPGASLQRARKHNMQNAANTHRRALSSVADVVPVPCVLHKKSVLHTQHDQQADRHLRVKHAHAWSAARHLHIAEEERTTMSALKGLRACVRVRDREREQQGERGRQGERECVLECA